MHYKDGTPAKLGDLVKGTGYNVKHEIQGVVTGLKAEDSCNISIAHLVPIVFPQTGCLVGTGSSTEIGPDNVKKYVTTSALLTINTEYGEAKNFELVNRNQV